MDGTAQEKWRKRVKLTEVKSICIIIGGWSIFIGVGRVEK